MTSRIWAVVTAATSAPGLQPDRVQDRGPRCPPRLQSGHDRIGPAGDHQVLVVAVPVGVAKAPVRRGVRVRPQPRRHIDGQDQTAVGRLRQRGKPEPSAAGPHRVAHGSVRRTGPRAHAGVPGASARPTSSSPDRPHTASRRSTRTAHRCGLSLMRTAPSGSVTAPRTAPAGHRDAADSPLRPSADPLPRWRSTGSDEDRPAVRQLSP